MSTLRYDVLVVGYSYCGKSNIIERFRDSESFRFSNHISQVDFFHFETNLNGKATKLWIWDFTGNEGYWRSDSFLLGNFRNAIGCLLVFDITNQHSFDDI